MKEVYIIRHAKSSWDNFLVSDMDRPLNERGLKDAPVMAKKIFAKKKNIDLFISSPAKRALKTCKVFCKFFGVSKEDIVIVNKLYLASSANFYDVIADIDDDLESVAIFSHNPGITEFVNGLVAGVHIYNMPTCAVFAVKTSITRWNDFKEAEKKFVLFDYPKHT